MTNKISIIIPTFNRIYELKKCLRSIFSQDYKNYEIIIIDNFSIDGTENYIKTLKNNFKINYLKIHNKGNIAKSRNEGILNSTGKYLAFIDSDDQWMPNKLSKSIKFIEENNLDFFYHDMILVKKNIISIGKALFRPLKNKKIYENLIENGPAFATSSVIVNKKIFSKIGNFKEDKDLITWEDYDAWIRVAKITNNFGFLKEKLGFINITNSNTLKNINKIKNIYSFKKRYLNNKKRLPQWCLILLIITNFKLKKYLEVKKYYYQLIIKNLDLKNKIKVNILYFISSLFIFLK